MDSYSMNLSVCSLLDIYSKFCFVSFCFDCMSVAIDVVFLDGWKLQKKSKIFEQCSP